MNAGSWWARVVPRRLDTNNVARHDLTVSRNSKEEREQLL